LLAGSLRDAIRVTEQAEASWVRTASEAGGSTTASPAAAVLPLRAGALLFMGRATDAEAVLDRARSIALEYGDHRLLAVVRAHAAWLEAGLAELQLALGDAPAAFATANRAVAKARNLGTRVYEIAALLGRAAAVLAMPEADAALGGSLLRVHSLIETTEARLF